MSIRLHKIGIGFVYAIMSVSFIFALFPWLNARGYSFEIPFDPPITLPQLDIISVTSRDPQSVLDWVYWSSEQPVRYAAEVVPDLWYLVYFRNSRVVRPFVLSMFWLEFGLAWLLVALVWRRHQKRWSRGELICDLCGYDLRGCRTGSSCPECGHCKA